MIQVLRRLVTAAIFGLLILLILGWLQNLHPAFDAVSSFRLHFLVLLFPLLVVTLYFKTWKITASGFAISLISLYLTTPYLPGSSVTKPISDLTVIQFNLRFNNPDPEAAIKVLTQYNPDIYLLQELTHRNFAIARALEKTHPYQVHCITSTVGGVAILSRHPFNPKFDSDCDRYKGLAITQILLGDLPITLANLHLKWPWPFRQHAQISLMKSNLANLPKPFILAGDFNAAPWTNAVQRLARFTNSKPANGLILTWRPRFIRPKIQSGLILPIDHILLRGAKVTYRKTLADGGSDHIPVLSEIKISN